MGSPLGLSFKPQDSGLQSATNNNSNKSYRVVENKAVKSLFDSGQFSPYPSSANAKSGSVEKIKNAFDVHSDESNDISITSIIQYCKKYPGMTLDYSHFAYLKNLGVYPNNRLIIARRFAGAVGNDLTAVTGKPMATIVGYLREEDDSFFSVDFNEEWEDADGSFEEILNEIGDDVRLSKDQGKGGAGKMVSAAFNIIPMPALMEGVQILVRQQLGLAGGGQGPGASPYGNPNLIRQAKQRKVIAKGSAGSALAAKFSMKMTVEYEQKFINGIDPTLVYLDILQNALTFGTSDATFEYSGAFARGATDIIGKLINGDISGIIQAITEFLQALLTAIKNVITDLVNKLVDGEDEEDPLGEDDATKKANIISSIGGAFEEYFKISVGTVISKYKIRLLGVANALSGAHSTPWHITIGNPKKPMFSSGDMQCTSVKVSLGKVLAFNDLPSSITLEIDLENARNLGAQEIFNRMNTGRGRSYKRFQLSFPESDDAIVPDDKKEQINQKNKDNNADTQKPALKADDKSKEDVTGQQPTDTKSAGTPNSKNEQLNNTETNSKDDYPVNFNDGSGTPWGVLELPDDNTVRTGDNTNPKVPNNPDTKPSGQSTGSNPNVVTSGLAGAGSNNTAGTGLTPSPPQPPNVPSNQTLGLTPSAQVTQTPIPTSDDVKSETAEKDARKQKLTEADTYTLAVVYNNVETNLDEIDSDIGEIKKFLKDNPNLATSDPAKFTELSDELEDLEIDREESIKTLKDIEEELENRKR